MKITIVCFLFLIHGSISKPVDQNDLATDGDMENPSKIELRKNRQTIRILSGDIEDDEDERESLFRQPIVVTPKPVYKTAQVRKPQPIGVGAIISRMFKSSSDDAAGRVLLRLRRQVEQISNGTKLNSNRTLAKQENDIENDGVEDKDNDDLDSGENDNDSASSEEDEEPPGGGDGQGGGILGLLAGLSGEGGQSDLGTLLATVGSIVANLSGGPGFDLNALIATAVGLFAGLSGGDGSQNIGQTLGGLLVTALEGFTGGGANNNGAFFGNLAATLVGGSSAAGNGGSSEEGGSDSGTFFASLISALLGGSSG